MGGEETQNGRKTYFKEESGNGFSIVKERPHGTGR